jgi:hypothetical protein
MDEPTTRLLERTVEDLAVPQDLLERVTRRKARRAGRRRMLAAAVAITVAIAGSAGAFVAFGGRRSTPGNTSYRDPTGQWQIAYPERFHRGSLPDVGAISLGCDGIWVANFAQPVFRSGILLPVAFPSNGVMVAAYQVLGAMRPLPTGPDSALPISVGDLTPPTGGRGPQDAAWRSASIVANGEVYGIAARLGPTASEADRRAAADIVGSFGVLPTHEGATIKGALTYYVLASPAAFPVGSVTRFDARNLPASPTSRPFPFYLVHVPPGFYALAWPDDRGGGYKDCAVTYDPDRGEFSCPNGARWSLDGSVIAKPAPHWADDPLEVLVVRFSSDGHVLVSPNVFMGDTSTDLQLTGR